MATKEKETPTGEKEQQGKGGAQKTGKPGSRTPAPPFTDPATSADRMVSAQPLLQFQSRLAKLA